MKKSACIETLYQELPFLERFQAARDDGFDAVEFWDWRDKDLAAVKQAAEAAGIPICGFNGDGEISMIDPDQREAYLEFLRRSLDAARFLGAAGLTLHSNGLGADGAVVRTYEELSDTVKICAMFSALTACARLGEEQGVTLYLEALNVTTDHPGSFLRHTRTAAELIRLVGSPRLRVLYDAYHMQLNEGGLCDTIRQYAGTFGHVHVADAPGRHEPGTGGIAYPRVFRALEEAGYTGLVGYELTPLRTTREAVRAIMETGPASSAARME